MAVKEIKKPISEMDRDELIQANEELHRQIKEFKRLQSESERRKEAEYRQRYYALFDNILDPVFITDAVTYKFLHCNQAVLNSYGYTREEVLNMTPFDLHAPDEFERVREYIDSRNWSETQTFIHLTKNRHQRTVEVDTSEIYFEGSPAWMSIARNVTERTRMEEELNRYKYKLEEIINERTIEVLIANKKLKQEINDRRNAELRIMESEQKFRQVIEHFLDGVLLVDERGSVVEWNRAQEKIYGVLRPQAVGKKVWDLLFNFVPHEKRTQAMKENIKNLWVTYLKSGQSPFPEEPRVSVLETSDGRTIDVQLLNFSFPTKNGVMTVMTSRDITHQLELERHLLQAGKMEAVGTLAGGIAHDFNNILSGILGYTDLAVHKSPKDAPIQKYLQQVLIASRRASDLVKQILTFSRPDKREKEPLLLCAVVKEAIKLLRSTLPDTIEIVEKIEGGNCYVLADPTQMHQVIMNLSTNAAHAMNAKGGILEVRLIEEHIEDSVYKELKPGPHVRLTISDTGHGIKQELLDKIFDPFFSTKKPGEGTGMGLAVVHRIIENHNGHISVYSKEGEGTMFSILLPTAVEVIIKEEQTDEEIPGGDERILVVEDDEHLAEIERVLLSELGYHVTTVTSSIEAYEIFKKLPDRFDLIITDYAMPRMTGTQLIQKIRGLRTDIPVIMCTGYRDAISMAQAKELGVHKIIMKPIEWRQIAKTLRLLLSDSSNL